jgi:hypothetical protein
MCTILDGGTIFVLFDELLHELRLAPGLADGGLLVVAGHVVPLDTVSIEVVQNAKAGLNIFQKLKFFFLIIS